MTDWVLFDLDGTVCDDRHRGHHILGGTKDWDSYHAACRDDILIPGAKALFDLLDPHYNIGFLSGREGKGDVPDLTYDWLMGNGMVQQHHDIPPIWLRPSPYKGPRTMIWKADMINQMNADGNTVRLLVDDHIDAAAVITERTGVPVLTVRGFRNWGDPVEAEFNPEELIIDVYRSGMRAPVSVRVTHKPTGLYDDAQGFSEMRARAEALSKLRQRVHALEEKADVEEGA